VRLELDALGADGDVGELFFAPVQRAARGQRARPRRQWCASPPRSVILGAAAEEDEDEGLARGGRAGSLAQNHVRVTVASDYIY
jgi:hypothetical protein